MRNLQWDKTSQYKWILSFSNLKNNTKKIFLFSRQFIRNRHFDNKSKLVKLMHFTKCKSHKISWDIHSIKTIANGMYVIWDKAITIKYTFHQNPKWMECMLYETSNKNQMSQGQKISRSSTNYTWKIQLITFQWCSFSVMASVVHTRITTKLLQFSSSKSSSFNPIIQNELLDKFSCIKLHDWFWNCGNW